MCSDCSDVEAMDRKIDAFRCRYLRVRTQGPSLESCDVDRETKGKGGGWRFHGNAFQLSLAPPLFLVVNPLLVRLLYKNKDFLFFFSIRPRCVS